MAPAAILDIDGGQAVMIGDSTWDCEAGAAVVFESIEDLRERVGQTPLGDGQATRELPRQA